MKRTLRGSKNSQTALPNMEDLEQMAKNVSPDQMSEVQNLVDRYSGKSESELMNELRYARQSGAIDPNELASVAQRLSPMLTPDQQQRLFSVMQQLK